MAKGNKRVTKFIWGNQGKFWVPTKLGFFINFWLNGRLGRPVGPTKVGFNFLSFGVKEKLVTILGQKGEKKAT